MIIVNKNEGTKIEYEVSNKRVTFDDDLTINLEKREEDWPVQIDVCYDADKALVIGIGTGRYYVAQIDIPPRAYDEGTGEDDQGNEIITKTARELDMDTVTLTLWSLDQLTPSV